jgi:hypothetical protein
MLKETVENIAGKSLNKTAGKEAVLVLAEARSETEVERIWPFWVKNRNLEGMECPLVWYAKDFEEYAILSHKEEEAVAARDANRSAIAANQAKVEESKTAVADWREALAGC